MGPLTTVFAWFAGIVAVVAFIGTPASAARIAGHGAATFGATAGAIIGAIPAGVHGFHQARNAAHNTHPPSAFGGPGAQHPGHHHYAPGPKKASQGGH